MFGILMDVDDTILKIKPQFICTEYSQRFEQHFYFEQKRPNSKNVFIVIFQFSVPKKYYGGFCLKTF